MTPNAPTASRQLFSIEGFLRTRSDHKAVLELDEIILRSDIDVNQKMELVNTLISRTVETVQEGGRHER